MRPTSPEEERKIKLRVLIVGIIIIAIVAGYFLLSNVNFSRREGLHFSETKLNDKKIPSGENTNIKLRILNRTNNTYKNLSIRLATKSPNIEIKHGNNSTTLENNEYIITVPVARDLHGEEETGSYTFALTGNLYPGLSSMTAEIEARILIDNSEIADSYEFHLTISSK